MPFTIPDPMLLAALLGVFLSVALLAGAMGGLVLSRMSPGRRRVRALTDEPPAAVAIPAAAALAKGDPGRLKALAKLVPKSPKELGRIGRRLARAGYYQSSAPLVFAALEMLTAGIGFVVPLVMLGPRRGLLVAAIGGLVGYMAPGMVLLRKIEARRKQLQNGLPDALDLFVVCLEAGCALDQAILKASEELALVYPGLAQELKLLMAETRAGKSRIEAFKNLAERTNVDDVRSLVAMLIQTDRFGTSVSAALKTHAEVSRTKRRQRAEERAAKVSVKLVFPLVLCLFPAFYVVTLGPAVIQFYEVFFKQMANR
jgi:tight adherence protein C